MKIIAKKNLSISECDEILQFKGTENEHTFSTIINHASKVIQTTFTNLDGVWTDEQFWKLSPLYV